MVCTGAGVAFALWRYYRQEPALRGDFPWGDVLLFGGIGFLCPSLPDLLEPATSPNHRQVFHSVAMAALVRHVAFSAHVEKLDPGTRAPLQAVALAYLSHLGADATTPASLPLLGFKLFK